MSASLWVFSLLWLVLATLQADAITATVSGVQCNPDKIITRDVVVIGGGSTGTYTAIRLLDSNKTVAVVEKQDRLGGHTQTYTDPVSGFTIDYGVIVFHNLTIVKDYFRRLNVSLSPADFATTGTTLYTDFRTGKVDSTYTPQNYEPGLAAYAEQVAKYPYVEDGFDLPYPVPADLLLPYANFTTKYGLQNFTNFLFSFAQGLGDLLAQPTLYVFKNFGSGLIKDLGTGLLTTALHDNSLLYEHATSELGDNVFLNSTILAVDRQGKGAQVLIQTRSGTVLIRAQKLVFTIPPKLDNLKNWDLSQTETTLFKQFGNSAYYTGVLRNTGIPDNVSSIVNIGADTLYNLPTLPGIYSVSQSGAPGLINVKFGSAYPLPDAEVEQAILASVKQLKFAGKNDSEPELAVFSSHTPFELTVPSKAIAAGFYKELYGLQSQRNTFYTGAAFHTHDSSLLWQFTEGLLPSITAALATVS